MITQQTLTFLTELKENNYKAWFDENRKVYDKVKAEYLSTAETLLSKMKTVDPELELLQPKECIFRINRDVRFSLDKSPYKTNLGVFFQAGGKKVHQAGYYLHIEPGKSFIGGGVWLPESATLQKIRKEIHYFYDDLNSILQNDNFKSVYGGLDEENVKLSRPPKGYESTDPAIEILKLKSFTTFTVVSDEVLLSPEFSNFCVEKFEILKPLIYFFNRGIRSTDDGGI